MISRDFGQILEIEPYFTSLDAVRFDTALTCLEERFDGIAANGNRVWKRDRQLHIARGASVEDRKEVVSKKKKAELHQVKTLEEITY